MAEGDGLGGRWHEHRHAAEAAHGGVFTGDNDAEAVDVGASGGHGTEEGAQ